MHSSVMHQSIPAVPIPRPNKSGAFVHVVNPGGGAFAILSRPRELGISVPRGTPGHLTQVFSKDDEFIGMDEAYVKDWLVRQRTRKTCRCFKGMFSQF